MGGADWTTTDCRPDVPSNVPTPAVRAPAVEKPPSSQKSSTRSIFLVFPRLRSAKAVAAKAKISSWEVRKDASHRVSASISANTNRAISFCLLDGRSETRLMARSSNVVTARLNPKSVIDAIVFPSAERCNSPLRRPRSGLRIGWCCWFGFHLVRPNKVLHGDRGKPQTERQLEKRRNRGIGV